MFRYYNANPKQKDESDCVCKAISLATNTDYYFIYYLLYDNAHKNCCEMLLRDCYTNILEDVFGLVRHCPHNKTVLEIAQAYPNNNVIIRIDGHLTCSICSVINDIWNCSDEFVTDFWVVE